MKASCGRAGLELDFYSPLHFLILIWTDSLLLLNSCWVSLAVHSCVIWCRLNCPGLQSESKQAGHNQLHMLPFQAELLLLSQQKHEACLVCPWKKVQCPYRCLQLCPTKKTKPLAHFIPLSSEWLEAGHGMCVSVGSWDKRLYPGHRQHLFTAPVTPYITALYQKVLNKAQVRSRGCDVSQGGLV